MSFLAQVTYTGNGSTTQYSITFPFLDSSHVKAFINGVETTAFTISSSTLTFNSAPANSAVVRIERQTPISSRIVDFTDGSVLTESDLDKSADQNFFVAQEITDVSQSTMKIATDDKFDAQSKVIKNVANPTNNQDAVTKYYLENTWLSPTDKTNLTTVAGISSDVTAVAGDATDIGTVATDLAGSDNVGTVAGAIANINTVAGSISNVNTVAGISSNVTTVAGNNTNVTTVANNISNINTVATNINDIVTVANDLNEAVSEIETVASDLQEAQPEIDLVAGSITNVNTVGGAIANVNTVAGISSNVSTVAGISGNVTTVAGISADVTTVAGANSNISSVAGSITNVNTVASNISDVNTFANRYRIGSSDPTSSNDAGDLFFNTTSSTLRFYNGTAWADIDTGIQTETDPTAIPFSLALG